MLDALLEIIELSKADLSEEEFLEAEGSWVLEDLAKSTPSPLEDLE